MHAEHDLSTSRQLRYPAAHLSRRGCRGQCGELCAGLPTCGVPARCRRRSHRTDRGRGRRRLSARLRRKPGHHDGRRRSSGRAVCAGSVVAGHALRIVDTTLRDGSHAIAHQFTVDQVSRIAKALEEAGVWAIAVGHGDGLGANSVQYGRPRHADAELILAARAAAPNTEIAVAILPGIGTKSDLQAAREAGATVARVSTVVTEADIGVQHLGLARELGMIAHTHLNTAHMADVEVTVEQAKIVANAGSTGVFLVDSAGALLTDDVRRRVAALRQALPDEVEVGIHEHNNLSLAVANSVAAIEEG